MDLPKYPVVAPEPMPDESRARQAAVALLVLEATLLGLSLPIQMLILVSLGWEGGDEALKQRMVEALPLLGLGGLLAAVLTWVAASAAWRGRGGATLLVASTAGLVVVLGLGWAATLRGSLVDPLFGPVWVVMTASAPLALVLLPGVRRVAAVGYRIVARNRGRLPGPRSR